MVWTNTPAGVVYTKQQIEYQHFPEEFFSGADVAIYFGDTFIDDITGLQFSLIENVKPIYGYASYTWDAVKHGTRIVQGRFSIAFREAGYLFRILDHIGQLGGDKAAPALSYLLSGQSVPKWHANALQTIEDLLGGGLKAPSKVSYIMLKPGDYEMASQDMAIMKSADLAKKLGAAVQWDDKNKKVIIGGKSFSPVSLKNGVSYVSIREVGEALGYGVEFDGKSGTIHILKIGSSSLVAEINKGEYIEQNGSAIMKSVEFAKKIGARISWDDAKRQVVINGQSFQPAKIESGVSYIRIRQVAEALGYTVNYSNGKITISKRSSAIVATINKNEYSIVASQTGRAVVKAAKLGQLLGVPVSYDSNRKRVIVGGHEFVPYKVEKDGSYVYVRDVAEKLGYSVIWVDGVNYIIIAPVGSLIFRSDKVKIEQGSKKAIMPAKYLCSVFGANPNNKDQFEIRMDGIYYFGRRYTKAAESFGSEPAVYVDEVFQDFNYTAVTIPEIRHVIAIPRGAEAMQERKTPSSTPYIKSMNDYEKEVWGDAFVPERSQDRHFKPFFYGTDNTEILQRTGFDIYIVYGPLSQDAKQRKNALPDLVSYNTTVRAIRNVQIVGCSQVLDPTGRPIEEVYEFIAQDID